MAPTAFIGAASALRHALRLIHCLQRERGASCALAGARAAKQQNSSNEGSEQLPGSSRHVQNVRLARASTNSAMHPFYLGGNVQESSRGVASKLSSIRQLVDEEPSATEETNEKYWFVHNVLKEYSSLLTFIIKVYVVDTIAAKMEVVNNSHVGSGKKERAALLKLLLSFVELKESLGFERAALTGIMVIGNTSMREGDIGVIEEETNLLETGEAEETKYDSSSGLPIIVNDVVMVVETQHRILSELQKQSRLILKPETAVETEEQVHTTPLDDNLLRLVGESIKQSVEMRSLQERIRKDFDVHGFHEGMTMDEFWADITLYMDKLHSMELLLLEELDQCEIKLEELDICSLETNSDHTLPLHSALKSAALGLNYLSRDDVVKCVNELSSEELKHSVISFLTQSEYEKPSSQDATKNLEPKRNFDPLSGITEDDKNPELKDWEISLYDVEFQRRIGRGAAGTTYLAKWTGQKVAVKVASISELGLDGWRTELLSLKRLHHPNIVRFLGAIYNPSPLTYCLVLEYCDGDLSAALEKDTPPGFVIKVALDIASGLCYLHKKNIMHRDIKPTNCLLQGDLKAGHYTAKLTDFGLAAMINNPSSSNNGGDLTAETGTYRYMAPEVIRHESYQYSADVYSYALMVWELITREVPFQPLGQVEAAGSVAMEDKRPPFPLGMPSHLRVLIENCWTRSPKERMGVPSIIEWFENASDHLTLEARAWLDAPQGHHVYETKLDAPTLRENKKKLSLLKSSLFGKKKRNDTFDRLR